MPLKFKVAAWTDLLFIMLKQMFVAIFFEKKDAPLVELARRKKNFFGLPIKNPPGV